MRTYHFVFAIAIAFGALSCATANATTNVEPGGCGGSSQARQPILDGDGGAGGTGGAGGGSAPREPQACADVSDCKTFPCDDVACVDGVCEYTKVPSGSPAAEQVPGDCVKIVCFYGAASQVDNGDFDDEDDCTVADVCVDGVPHHTPVTSGVPCSKGARCISGKCI